MLIKALLDIGQGILTSVRFLSKRLAGRQQQYQPGDEVFVKLVGAGLDGFRILFIFQAQSKKLRRFWVLDVFGL